MTLSRWRRVVTGVAAGVIVLCAALLGASFRDDGDGVSVASEVRPENVIPIAEDPVDDDDPDAGSDESAVDSSDDTSDDDDGITDPVRVIEPDDLADPDDGAADAAAEADDAADTDDTSPDDGATEDDTAGSDDAAPADDTAASDDAAPADDTAASDDAAPADDAAPEGDTDADSTAPADPAPADEPPLTATDDSLGTGGGVNDAECALDRLVIYAGARRGGVAGSIRAALAQAGFGAGCPTPVTVLASNCPLQFSGALGAGSGYDPNMSFVASSANVDRETMTAVMSTVGYSGNQIDILDFGFANPDRPGEQWMAIFIPPSFDGWQSLAGRAGLSPTTSSLCAASGQLAG